jgi:hypothetical protein
MSDVRRKLSPEFIPDLQEHNTTLLSIPDNVTETAKETGVDHVEDDDMNKLIDSS